jgi:hypothetical protein
VYGLPHAGGRVAGGGESAKRIDLIQNGQRRVRIMKQGSGRRTELELAGSALKQPPRSVPPVLLVDSIGQHLP